MIKTEEDLIRVKKTMDDMGFDIIRRTPKEGSREFVVDVRYTFDGFQWHDVLFYTGTRGETLRALEYLLDEENVYEVVVHTGIRNPVNFRNLAMGTFNYYFPEPKIRPLNLKQCWAMVNRIRNLDNVHTAMEWLNKANITMDDYDDLMKAVCQLERELYHTPGRCFK